MCGICGIIRFDNKTVDEGQIRKMMLIMKHRGPDDEGVFLENNIGLGFVRLSILDLSPAGHQPMFSQDGRFVLVYNGEIYNYIELREELIKEGYHFKTQTDSEVLLISFIHWGKECLNKFNGMWAFVIYDNLEKTIFASRDRFGVKPFYYISNESFFAFCSEIPPLLTLLDRKSKPDYHSIYDYLVFSRTDHTERTFFEEIRKLQHGHNIFFNIKSSIFNPNSSITRWYNLRDSLKQPFDNAEEFRESFSSAIDLRLRSDVPVGVSFSGGLDSSSIVSVLLKDYKMKDLNTFSAVYGKGESGDESEYIEELRPWIKNMHFITPSGENLLHDLPQFIKAHGEPIPSTSSYAQFKVMELAKKHVVVNLSGQGSDEEMAGYHYFFGFYFKDLLTHYKWLLLFKESIAYLKNHRSLYGMRTFGYFLLSNSLKNSARVFEKGYLNSRFVRQYSQGNSVTSGLYASKSLHEALLDHFEYKLEHLLKWEDRNAMWFSLETRVPFLDYRLVERTLSLQPEKIIKDGVTKHILREAMIGTLPEKIRTRHDKVGFDTPEAEWFRKPIFQMYIWDLIRSASFRNRGMIVPEKAEALFKQHLKGKIDISKEIWKWIHLENWYREYID
jgi:asparagine synthase (glutamine-hydrolysing)